jgi:hypothetical protein
LSPAYVCCMCVYVKHARLLYESQRKGVGREGEGERERERERGRERKRGREEERLCGSSAKMEATPCDDKIRCLLECLGKQAASSECLGKQAASSDKQAASRWNA